MFDGMNWRGGHGRGGVGFGHGPGFGGPRFAWGEGGGPFGRGGRHGGGGFGGGWFREGGGGRARRGEARYIVLDVLRDGPKHGYEIIKALEERSGGRYAPSPGSVYPILQYLEELGLVRHDQDGERRVYQLTDAGVAEWSAHSDEIAAFWERFAGPKVSDAVQVELGFLFDEFKELGRTAWSAAQSAGDDAARLRAMRQALERCKNEIRDIVAGGDGATEEV